MHNFRSIISRFIKRLKLELTENGVGIGLGMTVLSKHRARFFYTKQKKIKVIIMKKERPKQQGLYRQEFEHENCGIGFVATS